LTVSPVVYGKGYSLMAFIYQGLVTLWMSYCTYYFTGGFYLYNSIGRSLLLPK